MNKKTTDDSLIETILANNTGRVSISNNVVIINPANDLPQNTQVYVLID